MTALYTRRFTLSIDGKPVTMTGYGINFLRHDDGSIDRPYGFVADHTTRRGALEILKISVGWEDGAAEVTVAYKPAYRPKRNSGVSRQRYTAETVATDLAAGRLRGWARSHRCLTPTITQTLQGA